MPANASPEVLRGDRPTHAADLYSLGAILYQLVNKEAPYGNGTFSAVLARMQEGPYQPLPATIPADLVRLIAGLLERDSRKRLTVAQGLALLRRSSKPMASRKDIAAIASDWLAKDAAGRGHDRRSVTKESSLLLLKTAHAYLKEIGHRRTGEEPQPQHRPVRRRGGPVNQQPEVMQPPPESFASDESESFASDESESQRAQPARKPRTWLLVVSLAVLAAIPIAYHVLEPDGHPAIPDPAEPAPTSNTEPPARPVFLEQMCVEQAAESSTEQPARIDASDRSLEKHVKPDWAHSGRSMHVARPVRHQAPAYGQPPAHAQPPASQDAARWNELRSLWTEDEQGANHAD